MAQKGTDNSAQPEPKCSVSETGSPATGDALDHEMAHEGETATIEYIAEMSLCLRDMSAKLGMPFLAYLLEMVFQEAHCTSMRMRFGPTGQATTHQ